MKTTYLKLNLLKIVFCFALLVTMVGCGNTYKYKDHNYRTSEEALNALKYDIYDIKSRINPTKKKRGGNAVVVIPTFETFVALGLIRTGNPNQEQIDYVGKFMVASISAMAVFIDQRKIFNKVALIEDKYPIPAVQNIIAKYDAVIYLDLVSPQQSQWFIRARPEYKNMSINVDESKTVGYSRTLSWIESIEKRLDESGYIPRR